MNIVPMTLYQTAQLLARNYGQKDAVIIIPNKDGMIIGVAGLNSEELKELLCLGIGFSLSIDDEEKTAAS